jgi:hypothetical protein
MSKQVILESPVGPKALRQTSMLSFMTNTRAVGPSNSRSSAVERMQRKRSNAARGPQRSTVQTELDCGQSIGPRRCNLCGMLFQANEADVAVHAKFCRDSVEKRRRIQGASPLALLESLTTKGVASESRGEIGYRRVRMFCIPTRSVDCSDSLLLKVLDDLQLNISTCRGNGVVVVAADTKTEKCVAAVCAAEVFREQEPTLVAVAQPSGNVLKRVRNATKLDILSMYVNPTICSAICRDGAMSSQDEHFFGHLARVSPACSTSRVSPTDSVWVVLRWMLGAVGQCAIYGCRIEFPSEMSFSESIVVDGQVALFPGVEGIYRHADSGHSSESSDGDLRSPHVDSQ